MTIEMLMTPTSLKESAARTVKINAIPYTDEDLPRTMIDYLSSANCCVNPECKGEFEHLFSAPLELCCYGRMTITNEKKGRWMNNESNSCSPKDMGKALIHLRSLSGSMKKKLNYSFYLLPCCWDGEREKGTTWDDMKSLQNFFYGRDIFIPTVKVYFCYTTFSLSSECGKICGNFSLPPGEMRSLVMKTMMEIFSFV